MAIYLSAKTQQFFERPDVYGLMATYRITGGQWPALRAGAKWMLDNGEYTNNFKFQLWVLFMARMLPYRRNNLGIVVPDEPYNAQETLRKFSLYRAVPEAMGYKIAFATQDGMTADMIPWSLFDTLFIGGSDDHKRGHEAEFLAREGRRRGKWIHVGRVSGAGRILKHFVWADSFDSTTFKWDGGNWSIEDKMRTITPVVKTLEQRPIQWRML